MWSGTLATIPSGWILCDGTNSTPDLRNRFIYGVSSGENPGAYAGSINHTHYVDPASISTQQPSNTQLVASGGGVEAGHRYHTHTVDIPSTQSKAEQHLPPYYKLAYIMKQ